MGVGSTIKKDAKAAEVAVVKLFKGSAVKSAEKVALNLITRPGFKAFAKKYGTKLEKLTLDSINAAIKAKPNQSVVMSIEEGLLNAIGAGKSMIQGDVKAGLAHDSFVYTIISGLYEGIAARGVFGK